MVKIERSEYFFEMRTVECSFSQKGCSFDDCLKFRLMRWTDQFETIFDGEKLVRLVLTDDGDIEVSVDYMVGSEDEKDMVYDILCEFIEKIDGTEINPRDYNNGDLEKTKFPVINGIERRWTPVNE